MELETIGLLPFVILLGVVRAQYDYECPKPWLEFMESCYKFQLLPVSYQVAGETCARDGASLISVNSAAEHDFLVTWLRNHDEGYQDWFTSGRRQTDAIDRQFFWEGDGSVIEGFHFWFTERSRFENGDLIMYHTDGNKFGWELGSPDQPHPYICEINKNMIYKIIDMDRGYEYGAGDVDPSKQARGCHFDKEPQDFIYDSASVKKTVTMECIAICQPQPTYSWIVEKEQRRKEINPMEEPRYTIINGKLIIDKPTDTMDNGDYQCIANNEFGSILSQKVQLSFGYLLDFPKSKRDDVTVDAYAGVGIECNPPKHYPDILYSWYKDSILNFIRPALKPYIFVSNNGKLYFSSVTKDDEGEYYCLVFSPRAGVTSAQGKVSVPVNVRVRETIASIREPQIASGFPTVFPSSPLQGDDVRLECFAWGTNDEGELQYEWQRIGKPIPSGAILSDHNRVLTIPKVELIHAGVYKCTVSRVNGQSSSGEVQLPVDAVPLFTVPLKDAHLDLGGTLRWMCIASGKPSVSYTWYRNAEQITPGSIDPEDLDRITVQNNVLIFREVKEKDAGMYQCAASNLHGKRYSTAQLRVLSFSPNFGKRPVQPKTYATRRGNVTILCNPEAAPRPVKEWKKNNRPLNPSSEEMARVRLLPNGNLRIHRVTKSDEGKYTCVATNPLGKAESSGRLVVLSSTTISHYPELTVVEVNRTAFLPCEASYNPLLDLSYVWLHNSHPIEFIRIRSIGNVVYPEYNKYYTRGTGINRGGLYIAHAQFEMAGVYTCIARTNADEVAKSAKLMVIGPPGMPAGINVVSGNATSVTVHWSVGAKNGPSITSYVVEGFNEREDVWRELKTNIRGRDMAKRTTVITGLSPWSLYKFRIRAENELGLGEPSRVSQSYTTGEFPPEVAPENVGGGGGKVGDLTVTWDPLPEKDQNGPNLYYVVHWQRKGMEDEEWTTVNVYGAESKRYVVTVGSQNFYRLYTVRVQAVNNKGAGPVSPPVDIRSAEDIPIGVATDVRALKYNATAMEVTWNPVPDTIENIKGVLLGYRINYWMEFEEDETMSIYNVIRGQSDKGKIIGLKAHTYYIVNVQVFNSAGNGPKSQDFREETLRAAPMNAPQEVHVKVLDHDSVYVEWRGVSTGLDEEPLQGYMIRMWLVGESHYNFVEYDTEKKTHYEIHDLRQDVTYNMRIYAYSRGGEGLHSSPTIQLILGESCEVLQASPDKQFVYACDGCMISLSTSLLGLLLVSHLLLLLLQRT